MPVPEFLLTHDELYVACGGQKVAAKLLDERHTGKPWTTLADEAIRWGTTQALQAYGIQNDAQALQAPYPIALVEVAKYLAAAAAWRGGAAGDAMPQQVAKNEEIAQGICDKWVERKRTTANTPESPNQQPEWQIDPDPEDQNWTRRAARGFW